eukprot:SAG11_NODE_826_length_6982_cov_4.139038_2_plen_148_part_00
MRFRICQGTSVARHTNSQVSWGSPSHLGIVMMFSGCSCQSSSPLWSVDISCNGGSTLKHLSRSTSGTKGHILLCSGVCCGTALSPISTTFSRSRFRQLRSCHASRFRFAVFVILAFRRGGRISQQPKISTPAVLSNTISLVTLTQWP